MKPRIFVSAVSDEFRTARTRIEHILEFLGYEVVQQDIFGTEGGDLRQMLREKIDGCEALLQLTGEVYGFEPPEVDPDFGRVSYTQFEFLYAHSRGRKTYVLFAGPDCGRDTTLEKLDPDNQTEFRDLQSAYLTRLRAGGHIWHEPADDTALENAVLKIRNDSEELRKQYLEWQQNITDRLNSIDAKLHISKSRLREHLTTASEKALARDLAEADAIQGDWEKRRKLSDAAQAAHQQRLSRVTELADEFAALETGENASSTLGEMLRILDEESIDSALAYLASHSTRLVEKAAAKSEAARADLQPLLAGAQLALANGQSEKAEAFFRHLLAPGLPDWPQARYEYWQYLVDTKGRRQQIYESLTSALETYREASRQSRLLSLQNPKNTRWQHNLFVSQDRLGEIALARGDFHAARASFGIALEVAKSLVAREPGNTNWLRCLSINYNRLGDVASACGNLRVAQESYVAALHIIKTLTAHNPGNMEWQRDLSVCHGRLGNIASSRGDLTGAHQFFVTAQKITATLSAHDPDNTRWLSDLSIGETELGLIALSLGDLAAANSSHAAALEIRKSLVARESGNMEWQRDLSISHERLGDVAKAQGDLCAAHAFFMAALEIRKNLVSRDPKNMEWQRDLSLTHLRLGNIASIRGQYTEACVSLDSYFEIAKNLATHNPRNTEWQRDLSYGYIRLGDHHISQGNIHVAHTYYAAGLEIAKTVATRSPGNPKWQRDLSVSHNRLATVVEKRGDTEEARLHYRKSHDILRAVADAGKHVSTQDMKALEMLRQKAGIE